MRVLGSSFPCMVLLSPSTVAFLEKCVRSQLQIDVLLLVCQNEERWWSARQLCEELVLPEGLVSSALEALAAHNLLDVRIGTSLGYRFAPVDTWSRRAMTEAAARPHEARQTVARLTGTPRS